MNCCKKKCSKCVREKDRNDKIIKLIESLLETQAKLVEYIEEQKHIKIK